MFAKKPILKKICVAALCAVVLCAAALGSCGPQRQTAMSLTYEKNTTSISSNIYSYYLSYMKTMALANFYMMYDVSAQDIVNMDDIPEYWANEIGDGTTVGDRIKEQAEDSLKQFLAIAAYCKENNLELSKKEKDDIDAYIQELLGSSKYRRSKAALNAVLIRFNIDDTILGEIKRLEALTGVFARHAFPDGSSVDISDEMAELFYQETCSRVKHILIRYGPEGTVDAAVQAKIDEIHDRLAAGEEFDSMLSESADGMPFDGYTIRYDTPFVPEFMEAAFDMAIGEVRNVETEHGVHIMKKYELLPPGEAINLNTGETWAATILPELQRELRSREMYEVLKPYIDKIEVNRAETDLFSIAGSALMFDCMEILQ